MTEPIEQELRRALQPVDPGGDFAARLLARLPPEATVAPATPAVPARRQARYWLPAALAASLVAVVVVRQELVQCREQLEGQRAREQLLEALRVTSDKLDMAYHAVNSGEGGT